MDRGCHSTGTSNHIGCAAASAPHTTMNRIGNALQRHTHRHQLKEAVAKNTKELDIVALDKWLGDSKSGGVKSDKTIFLRKDIRGNEFVTSHRHSRSHGLITSLFRSEKKSAAEFHARLFKTLRSAEVRAAVGNDEELQFELDWAIAALLDNPEHVKMDGGMRECIQKLAAAIGHGPAAQPPVELPTPTLPEPPQVPRPVERLVAAPLKMPTPREKTVMEYTRTGHHLRTMHRERDAVFRQRFGTTVVDAFKNDHAPRLDLSFKQYPDRFEQLSREGETPIKAFMRRQLAEQGRAPNELTEALKTLFQTTPLLGVLEKDTSDALIGICATLAADQTAATVGRSKPQMDSGIWAIDSILLGVGPKD